MLEALCQAPRLDGEDFLATGVPLGSVGGHKGMWAHVASELGLGSPKVEGHAVVAGLTLISLNA